MFEVELSQRADKFLQKLPLQISNRIISRLKKLGETPFPKDAKFIGRDDGKIFRYRIGDYRALYMVIEERNIVLVIKIDKRPRVYS